MEQAASALFDQEIGERIAALAENAACQGGRSPRAAALSWHEAGRLLDHRVGLLREAWICYSLALGELSEHKPSLNGLRRLARRAGASDVLSQLIEAQLGDRLSKVENAGLLVEKAMLEARATKWEHAFDRLDEAADHLPDSIFQQLLRTVVAAQSRDDAQLAKGLTGLSRTWPSATGAAEFAAIAGLAEEQLGHGSVVLEQLDSHAPAAEGPRAIHWMQLRLGIELGRIDKAIQAASALLDKFEAANTRWALARLGLALGSLAADRPAVPALDRAPEEISWDLLTLATARGKLDQLFSKAIGQLATTTNSDGMKQALAIARTGVQWKLGQLAGQFPEELEPDSAPQKALSWLVSSPAEDVEKLEPAVNARKKQWLSCAPECPGWTSNRSIC
jgi:tetratricopeptide (TPR) repeat protein